MGRAGLIGNARIAAMKSHTLSRSRVRSRVRTGRFFRRHRLSAPPPCHCRGSIIAHTRAHTCYRHHRLVGTALAHREGGGEGGVRVAAAAAGGWDTVTG